MPSLKVLGAARLEAEDGRPSRADTQAHRIALLTALSAAPAPTPPREKLMAMLWPDQPVQQARHLLNVSVHVIRRVLGGDVLRTEGPNLSLDTTALPSDL